jgi:hypothetical protein
MTSFIPKRSRHQQQRPAWKSALILLAISALGPVIGILAGAIFTSFKP